MLAIAWLCAALAAEPLLLDAGGLDSPVHPGFARLDPYGSTDPRATWEKPPPRPARWVGEPDALAGDWLPPGGVLRLALEPGAWTLHVMLGEVSRTGPPWFAVRPGEPLGVRVDGAPRLHEEVPDGEAFLASPWYARAPFPAFVDGETEWERQVAPRHPWRSVDVVVGEDGLSVEPYGAALQALVAVPAAEVALGEVLRETTALARREAFETFVAPESTVWGVPATGSGPLRVQALGWDALPDADAPATTSLSWALAPDERTGVALWLFPGDGAVTWRVEGLDGLDVRGHEIHWLDQRGHTARTRQPRPAFLRPSDGTLRGGQGAPVGLGLVVRVPAHAAPGAVSGRVVLERGADRVVVPISARVRDLPLAPLPVPVGFFADVRIAATLAGGSGSELARDALEADLALMREHGATAVALARASPWPGRWTEADLASPALFEHAVAQWRALGGTDFVWMDPFHELVARYRSPGSPDADARLARAVALAQIAARHDVPIYVYDEEGGRRFDAVQEGAEVAAALRSAAPGVRLFAAVPHPLEWDAAGTWDVALTTHQPTLSAATTARIRATGASPWAYNLVPGRAAPGLMLWALGAEGMLQWHWNDAGGDPFDDVHQTTQHQYAIGAPGGIAAWPTVMLASFAEGIADHRYLATLEALVDDAERARSPRRRAAALHGRALLDAARGAMDGAWPVGVHDGSIASEQRLALLRDAVGDAAEALRAYARPTRTARPDPPEAATALRWSTQPVVRLPTRRPWAPPVQDGVPTSASPHLALDGQLDEPGWSLGSPGRSAQLLPDGPPVPDVGLRALVTPDGLALAITGLPPGYRARILVDPQGAGQRWFVVTVDASVVAEVCGFPPLTLPVERYLSPRAAPCVPAPTPRVASDGETREILWSWTSLGPASGALRVGGQVLGPDGVVATWTRTPGRTLGPDDALPLADGRPAAWLRIAPAARDGVRTATLRAASGPRGRWQWVVMDRGALLQAGAVNLEGAEATFTFAEPGHEWFTVLAVADEPGPLPHATMARARWDYGDLALTTPVFDDAIELAWRLPAAVSELEITVRDVDGALLGDARVDLDAGTGALRVEADPGWPDTVRVEAAGFGVLGTALRRHRHGAP